MTDGVRVRVLHSQWSSSACPHAIGLQHGHWCPELCQSPSADPEQQTDRSPDLLSDMMELLQRLDLLGDGLLELLDPEQALQEQESQSGAAADGAVQLSASRGRPVRSVVEWVTSAHQQP